MKYSRDDINELLANKMLSFRDYAEIPVDQDEDSRSFVVLSSKSRVLTVDPIGREQTEHVTDGIVVRDVVQAMLHLAGQRLRDFDSDLQLQVVYGFRPLKEQRRLFELAKRELSQQFPNENDLLDATHRQIAVPEVAGHPTGGAVDVHIVRNGAPIEMGSNIWDFTPEAFTFSPFVNRTAWEHRQLLRRAMMEVGFAPFDGEWWHFSYGDKEWARFYDRPRALFGQVDADELEERMDATIPTAG